MNINEFSKIINEVLITSKVPNVKTFNCSIGKWADDDYSTYSVYIVFLNDNSIKGTGKTPEIAILDFKESIKNIGR